MNNSTAILIPVFNGLHFLKKQLPAISRQISKIEDFRWKIIVIDDNSTDGTSAWISQFFPEVTVLSGNGSLWWSGGVNKGVSYALSRKEFTYVMLWNHDILCADDYFETMGRKIPDYQDHTIIASKIYFLHKPEVIFNMGAFFNPVTGVRTLNGYGCVDSEAFSAPAWVDWTGGMGTLIPVDAFRQVGFFDEKNFPQYHGDSDFFLRAREKGYRLVVLPDLKIWNDKSSSGLEHNARWHLFFRSLTSIKSNHNIIIEYKFLKRHCTSFLFHFYYVAGIFKYFTSFIKHWILSLLKKR